MAEQLPLIYRGYRFVCGVMQLGDELFQPIVRYVSGPGNIPAHALLKDTSPYRTLIEARRHAELQAIRWVHEYPLR